MLMVSTTVSILSPKASSGHFLWMKCRMELAPPVAWICAAEKGCWFQWTLSPVKESGRLRVCVSQKMLQCNMKIRPDDDVFLCCRCASDVEMGSGGGEEAEKMSTDTGLELHAGGAGTRASMLRRKSCISSSRAVRLCNFIVRWEQSRNKRPSPPDALLRAAHESLLITARRSPCRALAFQHVRFAPPVRKP